MPFVKLDCGMLNSTIWFDHDAREVFITALLMAEPCEALEPQAQIEVRSLKDTGWKIPAGWYGMVEAAGPGIVHRAGLEQERGLDALERLGSPEPGSRSSAFEGRRLVRVDGGYLVLNYMLYRERDSTAASRSKRWRERKRMLSSRVSPVAQRVIRHQAEADKDKRYVSSKDDETTMPPPSKKEYPADFEAVWGLYPKREGANSKAAAFKSYQEALRAGATVEALKTATLAYAFSCVSRGVLGTEYVMQGERFYRAKNRYWEDDFSSASHERKFVG